MCGILVGVGTSLEAASLEHAENSKRGPDMNDSITVKISNCVLEFRGYVLGLRGPLTSQPFFKIDSNGIFDSSFPLLLFNGEAYGGLNIGIDSNDGQKLYEKLCEAETEKQMLEIISVIEGEWSLVLLFKNNLYFGRDFLGRRSLLMKQTSSDSFVLASVSSGENGWTEVLANGIYRYDFNEIKLLEWNGHPGLTCPHLRANIGDYHVTETDLDLYPPFEFSQLESHFRFDACLSFKTILESAVFKRVVNIPQSSGARLAILFSGGVDCMVLAALAHQCLQNEPIDLLNVAFENPRTSSKLPIDQIYNVPDRLTARQGFRELVEACPREWRLVEINVPYSEYCKHKDYVAQLIYPLHSVMDLSIAIAFWFASRGIGTVNQTIYQSQAKVLLSGLGADEQLGGYSRHRSAYFKGGWSLLASELDLDISRISTRNLGRDDRIISSHGKEVRFPFLDRTVLNLLLGLPVHYKTDPRLEREIGDKLLIRMLAFHLGLPLAAKEAKRAVQFGAKTAKMELNSGASRGQDTI